MAGTLYRSSDKDRVVAPRPPDETSYRSVWRRDYARVLHSAAFRRLQGKTQLFPGHEGDFFRNRLTHSLEVAQIAKSIALRLNATEPFFAKSSDRNIDPDLVETAALSHDLGHPPFGHNGEAALDRCMRDFGGFEGNAQSLRILSKLEKRQTRIIKGNEPVVCDAGIDQRVGLNLTYRTLAAALKYDRPIPARFGDRKKGEKDHPIKGFYQTEQQLVADIKAHVGTAIDRPFKTIECSIMDIADDIAYSTYDLEDAFKGGFLNPLSMITYTRDVMERVRVKVEDRLRKAFPRAPREQTKFTMNDLYGVLVATFSNVYCDIEEVWALIDKGTLAKSDIGLVMAQKVMRASQKTAGRGYYRTKFTSELVNDFINGVEVDIYDPIPALSIAKLNLQTMRRVETLKNFTYEVIIMSPTLKVVEHRGMEIVSSIFKALSEDGGHYLMPEDYQSLYTGLSSHGERKRAICDFIAGMTDQYALKFYARLYGTSPESIYSPL